jgi:hypothetical protein
MDRPCYYWGCIGESGHYLWTPGNGHPSRSEWSPWVYRWPPGFPTAWQKPIDSGLLKAGKIPDQDTGEVYTAFSVTTPVWFAFVWWDNSVDHRPGSNSGFYLPWFNDYNMAEIFQVACACFPAVVSRQEHPLVLKSMLAPV